jgi:hypothetical protein
VGDAGNALLRCLGMEGCFEPRNGGLKEGGRQGLSWTEWEAIRSQDGDDGGDGMDYTYFRVWYGVL